MPVAPPAGSATGQYCTSPLTKFTRILIGPYPYVVHSVDRKIPTDKSRYTGWRHLDKSPHSGRVAGTLVNVCQERIQEGRNKSIKWNKCNEDQWRRKALSKQSMGGGGGQVIDHKQWLTPPPPPPHNALSPQSLPAPLMRIKCIAHCNTCELWYHGKWFRTVNLLVQS